MKRQPKSSLTLPVDASDTESVNIGVGPRLKRVREALRLTQAELADAVGGSKRGLQDNETRNRVPGGEVIAGFVRLGINANWLLTGEGPMLLEELDEVATLRTLNQRLQAERDALAARLAQPQPVPLNEPAMRAIITGVLEGQRGRDVPSEHIARRAVDLYRKALDEGLITPTGVGEGNLKKAG